jgi:hypothetical protein
VMVSMRLQRAHGKIAAAMTERGRVPWELLQFPSFLALAAR